jgi:hypothetical protein
MNKIATLSDSFKTTRETGSTDSTDWAHQLVDAPLSASAATREDLHPYRRRAQKTDEDLFENQRRPWGWCPNGIWILRPDPNGDTRTVWVPCLNWVCTPCREHRAWEEAQVDIDAMWATGEEIYYLDELDPKQASSMLGYATKVGAQALNIPLPDGRVAQFTTHSTRTTRKLGTPMRRCIGEAYEIAKYVERLYKQHPEHRAIGRSTALREARARAEDEAQEAQDFEAFLRTDAKNHRDATSAALAEAFGIFRDRRRAQRADAVSVSNQVMDIFCDLVTKRAPNGMPMALRNPTARDHHRVRETWLAVGLEQSW